MAEAAAWRVQVRRRVVVAHQLFGITHHALQAAKGLIEMPVPPSPEIAQGVPGAWIASYRLKHVLAMDWAMEATQNLFNAAVSMEAAEILALHGCSLPHPSLPLQSIDHIGPQEGTLRLALGWLRFSRVAANDARDFTEWCRGHLSMQIALIDRYATIPDVTVYNTEEETTAYNALTYAIQRTASAFGDLITALQFL